MFIRLVKAFAVEKTPIRPIKLLIRAYLPWIFPYSSVRLELERVLAEKLTEIDTARKVVVDVGCGTKPYRHLFHASSKYFGLDRDEYSVNQNGILYPDVWIEVTSKELPLADSSCDLIVLFQVLEHVDDIESLVRSLARVLKSGGKLIISVPFMGALHELPEDYRRFTPSGLAQLLASPYFEISTTSSFGSSLLSVASIIEDLWGAGFASCTWQGRCFMLLLYPWVNGLTHAMRLVRFVEHVDVAPYGFITVATRRAHV